MVFKTLRQLFKFKKIKFIDVACRSGYSRQTVHTNLDEIPSAVSVRALRELAAVAGGRVVIRFELDESNETPSELCRTNRQPDSGQA